MPLNPSGHLQIGSTPFGDSQIAFGPQASLRAQGLYLTSVSTVVNGVTKNGSVVASSSSSLGVVWNVVVVVFVVGLKRRSVVVVSAAGDDGDDWLVLSISSSS